MAGQRQVRHADVLDREDPCQTLGRCILKNTSHPMGLHTLSSKARRLRSVSFYAPYFSIEILPKLAIIRT